MWIFEKFEIIEDTVNLFLQFNEYLSRLQWYNYSAFELQKKRESLDSSLLAKKQKSSLNFHNATFDNMMLMMLMMIFGKN